MEDNTWIKLYRKLLESPIFENEKALKIWIWCLLKATHKDREQLVGAQIVYLKKGEFVFGRIKASEELKMSETTIYRYMQLLDKLQMISIKPNNKYSVVSIEKWEDYQVEEQQADNKQTTSKQQADTNKNVKNVKNIYSENKKNKFGEYQNVFFTDEQYEKLTQIFPKDHKKRIEALDNYMQSTGKKYKDCLATIRSWARKEGYKEPKQGEKQEYTEVIYTDEEYEKLLRESRMRGE